MSQVHGLDLIMQRKLKKLLSYIPNAKASYYSGAFGPKRTYLISKDGSFPTGLLERVAKFLSAHGLPKIIRDNRIVPKPILSRFTMQLDITPYPEQENAANACLRAYRGIISAPTGLGKSIIAALIINKFQVKTLIVVPTLELKRQLTKSLSKIFGTIKVGSLKRSFEIAIENIDALDPNKPVKGYECLILDEFHRSAAKTYQKLNKKAWNDIYFRIGLTATPFRTDEQEMILLESILSKVIYEIRYQDCVKNKRIVPVEAYYYDLPAIVPKGRTWAQVYSELVVNNKDRNGIIAKVLQSLEGDSKSALCLVKEIRHGEILSALTSIPFANGQDDASEGLIAEFNSRQLSCLIGTTGILGMGVDTKPCEYVIIAGLGKSKVALMQQIGRALRLYPGKESAKVLIFRDSSHKFTRNHFNEQVKVISQEYGVSTLKLALTL